MTFTFRAMGTEIAVIAPALAEAEEAELGRRARAMFAATERRFSRFLPDSELSRLNRARGPFVASEPLFSALLRARGYFEATAGLFDPTVGAALSAAGYDRPFAPGALDRAAPAPPPPAGKTFADVVLDEATRSVVLPEGLALDLGGFVKGWTADQAARLLPVPGAVDAGGDAAIRGDGPDGEGWLVDVEDPADARRVLLTLRVRDNAVATSAPNRRRWTAGAAQHHHLVDPRTRRSAESDLAQVTVIAASAERADVLAKTAFFLGRRAARAWIARLGEVSGVLVGTRGEIDLVGQTEVVHA